MDASNKVHNSPIGWRDRLRSITSYDCCMASSADTPRARALGAELRQARERRGLTTRRLAEIIGRSSSHISRWENGKLIPSEADTATVLAVLGINGADRDRLLELARDALDPNWIAPGTDKQLAALTEYERTAETITNVEPLMIPGLLQTYEYARHIMIAFGHSRGEAEHRATLRIGRQHVLTEAQPKQLVAIVGEFALRHPICPEDVMLAQARRLLELAERDKATWEGLVADADPKAVMFRTFARNPHIGTNGGTAAGLVGSYDTVAKRILEFRELGIGTLMLQFQPFEAEQRRFAAEVIPRYRELAGEDVST